MMGFSMYCFMVLQNEKIWCLKVFKQKFFKTFGRDVEYDLQTSTFTCGVSTAFWGGLQVVTERGLTTLLKT